MPSTADRSRQVESTCPRIPVPLAFHLSSGRDWKESPFPPSANDNEVTVDTDHVTVTTATRRSSLTHAQRGASTT